MTMRYSVVTILSLGMFLAYSSPAGAADHPLRVTLETAWKDFVAASESGKESELEKSMSSFYFATLRNNLARAGRPMTPENLSLVTRRAPDSGSTSFVTVLENGPTAGLVHVRDSSQKDASGKPRVEFVFVKFVNEGQGWKVDGRTSIHALKYQDDGKLAPFNPARLAQGYQIDGQIRKAPASSPGIAGEAPRSAQRFQESLRHQGDGRMRYNECVKLHASEVKLANLSTSLVQTRKRLAAAEALQAEKLRNLEKPAETKGPGERARPYFMEPAQLRTALERIFQEYRKSGGPATTIENVTALPNPCSKELEGMRTGTSGPSPADTPNQTAPGQAPSQ